MLRVEIENDDELYRRIAAGHLGPDGKVTSAAFKLNGKPDHNISVDLAKLTSAEACLNRAPGPRFGLGVMVSRFPRSLGFNVKHDPLPDNLAHSLIEGQNNKEKCRLLADETKLIVIPRHAGPW